jgi:hypothetical protein
MSMKWKRSCYISYRILFESDKSHFCHTNSAQKSDSVFQWSKVTNQMQKFMCFWIKFNMPLSVSLHVMHKINTLWKYQVRPALHPHISPSERDILRLSLTMECGKWGHIKQRQILFWSASVHWPDNFTFSYYENVIKFLRLASLKKKKKLVVKLSVCLIKHHAMKIYVRVEVEPHAFLTSALDRDEWPALPSVEQPPKPIG